MSQAITWRSDDSMSSTGMQHSALMREAALESRLDALREIALTVLRELETLSSAQPRRTDHKVKLQEEVQRFESDLIRTALARTGGNQASAARLLGVKHTTLNAKIKRFKIAVGAAGDCAARQFGDQEIVA
jgi:transcriptional regulator with GAF, ATPase, and Fis domain